MSEQQVTLRIKGDASGLQQAARSANDSLGRIGPAGEQSGRQVATAMNQAERETSKLARVAGTLAASLGAGITALSAITKSAIDNADATRKMAQMIGLSVDSLSTLQFAADQSGVAAESLREALTRLSANAADAARGVGNAKDAFAALGISVANADGTLRTSREILGSVAERFSQVEDGVAKTSLAVDIFGRAGASLIPLLNQGADGIEELEQRARDLGLEMSNNTASQAEQFNDLLAQLSDLSRGLGNDIARELLPSLVAYTSQMVDAGIETRKSTGFIEGFATVIRGIIATLEIARRGVEGLVNVVAASVDVVRASARAGQDFITAYTPFRVVAAATGQQIKTSSQIIAEFTARTRAATDSAGTGFRGAIDSLSRTFEALFNPAARDAADATDDVAGAARDAAPQIERKEKATKAAAEATRDAADAERELLQALDIIESTIDGVAGALGGPVVRAAQELRDSLVNLATAEEVLNQQGLLTEDIARRIQLAREGVVLTYQRETDAILDNTDAQREAARIEQERLRAMGVFGQGRQGADWFPINDFADLLAIATAEGMTAGLPAFLERLSSGLANAVRANPLQLAEGSLDFIANFMGNRRAGRDGAGSFLTASVDAAANSGSPEARAVAQAIRSIDAIFKGRLLGTTWQRDRTGLTLGIGEGGVTGSTSETQVRQRSFFRGRQWSTTTSELESGALSQIEGFLDNLRDSLVSGARALRTEVPPLIEGAFSEVRDAQGRVIRQTSTILGRTFSESVEDFQRRLSAENIIALVDRALGPTVRAAATAAGQQAAEGIGAGLDRGIGEGGINLPKSIAALQGEASAIAERWRQDASQLLDGAQLLLRAATDLRAGFNLLGDGSLTDIVDLVEDLSQAGEPLADAYGRIVGATRLLDEALALSSVTLDRAREQVVRFAVDIAEAAGGVDQAAALWRRFFDVAYDEEERLTAALAQAEQARDSVLGGAGLDSATTLDQVRAAIEALLATGGDPERIVALLQAADAIATVNELLAELALMSADAGDAVADVTAELARLAEIDQIMSEVFTALDGFDMSDFARELQRITRAESARIATLTALGASEAQLSAVRRLATLETQAAIAGLRASIASLRDQLQGTPLSRIEEQIRQFQSGQVGAIQSVGAAAESMWGNQFAHVQRIDDYLRSLLTGPNSLLTPRQRVDAAMQDYRETLRLAQLGDADALGRITQVADVALRELRSYFGSSGPTQDFFAQLQRDLAALRGVGAVGGPVSGGGAVGGGGPAPIPPELAALLAERDRLIAEQQARERLSLATTLAQQLGELSAALQRPFEDLAAELGIDLESLARDLGIDPDGIAALVERLTTTRVAESQLLELESLTAGQAVAIDLMMTQTGILESIRDGIERLTPVDLPSFDVGSGGVPRTGLAQVHRGEIILPPAVSDFARRSGLSIGASGGGNGGAVEARLAELIQATREASERQDRRLERLEAATVGSGDRITRTLETSGARRM